MKKIFILLLTTFMLISCSSGYLGKYSVDYIKLSDGTEAAVNGSMRIYENRIEFDDMDTKIDNVATIIEKREESSGCYFTIVDKQGNKRILYISDYHDEVKLMDMNYKTIGTFRAKKNVW